MLYYMYTCIKKHAFLKNLDFFSAFQFFSVLLLIFIGVVGASALAYVYREQVGTQLQKGIQSGLDNYDNKNNTVWKQEMDFMQEQVTKF